MIGRADIEGSKSDVAMNAWPPQASYPCGNFSDTSCRKLFEPKGSIGRAFAVPVRTEHRDQVSFCPFALREVSVLAELTLGHLRYSLTDVPPQSNSPPGSVLGSDRAGACVGVRPVRREAIRPATSRGLAPLCAFGSRTTWQPVRRSARRTRSARPSK